MTVIAAAKDDPRFIFETKPHGQGGFGKIIKGRDNVLDRDIAVKVLDPLLTQFSEAERERFKREARTLARLSHPNIPAVYDVLFKDEQFLIVFQFVEGINLRKILEDEGPADLTRIIHEAAASDARVGLAKECAL
jgi:eukaryotic-like serine/threonine-protein kinase